MYKHDNVVFYFAQVDKLVTIVKYDCIIILLI